MSALLVVTLPTVNAQVKDARSAKHVLDAMVARSSEIPRPFIDPLPDHIAAAEKFLATMRLADMPADFPQPKKGGPPPKPWRAAAEFARCFGVTTMPLKPKDAKRKTARRRNKPKAPRG